MKKNFKNPFIDIKHAGMLDVNERKTSLSLKNSCAGHHHYTMVFIVFLLYWVKNPIGIDDMPVGFDGELAHKAKHADIPSET